MKSYFCVSERVARAIADNKPVVALESTIISHGMPYPQNVQTALEVERIVRAEGCTPATVAVINGVLTVGCDPDQIELLGKMGTSAVKVSRRDLPIVAAQGKMGATTVAGTMYACGLAGVDVFATGGIGGAHRNSQYTMDISADLDELQQTNVAVVCAGAKSILDIGLTLECLETRGVPVVGYQTDEMPAFYTRSSGYKVDYRMDSARQIAQAILAQKVLKTKGGMLIVDPIPQQYSMDPDYINAVIEREVKRADESGITGKALTPHLLAAIERATEGKSLAANIQLVFNNVRLACQIARELCALRSEQ